MRTDDEEEICCLKQEEQGLCSLGSEEPMGGWWYHCLCLVSKEGSGRLIPVGWNSGRLLGDFCTLPGIVHWSS